MKLVGGRPCRSDCGVKRLARPGNAFGKGGQIARLRAVGAQARDPEVVCLAGKVCPRLLQYSGDRADPSGQLLRVFRRQGILVGPQIDPPVNNRALVCRHVALGGVDHHVEGRVAGPRAAYPVIEVEPIHLGANEVPVDLPGNRPILVVQRVEARPHRRQHGVLECHGAFRIIRNSIHEGWGLELAPLAEELHEILVLAVKLRPRRIPGRTGRQYGKEESGQGGGRSAADHSRRAGGARVARVRQDDGGGLQWSRHLLAP